MLILCYIYLFLYFYYAFRQFCLAVYCIIHGGGNGAWDMQCFSLILYLAKDVSPSFSYLRSAFGVALHKWFIIIQLIYFVIKLLICCKNIYDQFKCEKWVFIMRHGWATFSFQRGDFGVYVVSRLAFVSIASSCDISNNNICWLWWGFPLYPFGMQIELISFPFMCQPKACF